VLLRSLAQALWVRYHYCIEAIGYISKYPGCGAMMTKPISETSAAVIPFFSPTFSEFLITRGVRDQRGVASRKLNSRQSRWLILWDLSGWVKRYTHWYCGETRHYFRLIWWLERSCLHELLVYWPELLSVHWSWVLENGCKRQRAFLI
jgi:hypothetical protein